MVVVHDLLVGASKTCLMFFEVARTREVGCCSMTLSVWRLFERNQYIYKIYVAGILCPLPKVILRIGKKRPTNWGTSYQRQEAEQGNNEICRKHSVQKK